jgi:hypothetical protein
MHALTAHLRALGDPEVIPKCIVGGVRNPSIEADLPANPTLRRAHGLGESQGVVVRIVVAKGRLRAVEVTRALAYSAS